MRCVSVFLLSIVCLLAVSSCQDRRDESLNHRLLEWDKMVDLAPQQVADSLRLLNSNTMSRGNKAYYNLLKVISDDKTYINFTSDSLINSVADYYRNHDPRNRNHIRALAYQGIVRTRMGVKDSTVFDPLKEAEKLLKAMPARDPSLGYLINYCLGNIHYNSRNYSTADDYFHRTLNFAQEEEDSRLSNCW